MRHKYPTSRPHVYLIRHTITKDKMKNDIYRKNKYTFDRIKEGDGSNILLIYKYIT